MDKQLKEIYLNFSFSVLNTVRVMLTTKDSINEKKKKDRKRHVWIQLLIFKYIFTLVSDWLTKLQQVHWFKMYL